MDAATSSKMLNGRRHAGNKGESRHDPVIINNSYINRYEERRGPHVDLKMMTHCIKHFFRAEIVKSRNTFLGKGYVSWLSRRERAGYTGFQVKLYESCLLLHTLHSPFLSNHGECQYQLATVTNTVRGAENARGVGPLQWRGRMGPLHDREASGQYDQHTNVCMMWQSDVMV